MGHERVARGRRGAVASGHFHATEAGARVLAAGGNAVDAAAAMAFCLAVVEPHLNGLGGEVPILVHRPVSVGTGDVTVIAGQGWAPRGATPDAYRRRGYAAIPGDGLSAATVPAMVDAWCTAVSHFGTRNLSDLLEPATRLASEGFVVGPLLHGFLRSQERRIRSLYPTTFAVFYPSGRAPAEGEVLRQTELGRTLQRLREAADQGTSASTAAAAARQMFHDGALAKELALAAADMTAMDDAQILSTTPLGQDDLRAYRARLETSMAVPFDGWTVHKAGAWSQAPLFLQTLRMLHGAEGMAALPGWSGVWPPRRDSADHWHLFLEALKLSLADREAYYGDTADAHRWLSTLLSDSYARARAGAIDPARASAEIMPGPLLKGPPEILLPWVGPRALKRPPPPGSASGEPGSHLGDTTSLCAVDASGLMVAATQSGGWIQSSPLLPGLGFALTTRAQMFNLLEGHPNVLAPHKRPRTTLTPTLALGADGAAMAFCTPGGDGQDQWLLQFFLDVTRMGLGLEEAVQAPTLASFHVPSSFYPHEYRPAAVAAESRFPPAVLDALRDRGHRIEAAGPWEHGRVTAVRRTAATGLLEAAASSRRETASAMALD